VLEYPIHGDVALIKAERGDRWGNLTYRKAARNFGPVMAMAARITVASVHEVVELGRAGPRGRGHARHPREPVVQVPRRGHAGRRLQDCGLKAGAIT
jgi:3-oxoadipate CoA-transferase alpha subunit